MSQISLRLLRRSRTVEAVLSATLGKGIELGNCTCWNPLQAECDCAKGLCRFVKEKDLEL